MDGTKPAMESNAEETQDEGQESKGTLSRPPKFASFVLCFLWRRLRLRQPERFNLLAMASRLCASETIAMSPPPRRPSPSSFSLLLLPPLPSHLFQGHLESNK